MLLLVTLACGFQGGTDATAQALGAALNMTSTARAGAGNPSSGDSVATAQAQATINSQNFAATQAALGAVDAEFAAATAAVEAPIRAELATYGVDPSVGRVGWIHPPADMVVEGYKQFDYINQFAGTLAADFVVSGDITWNTDTGISGCGFVIRSNGQEEALDQYMVIITRGGSGTAFFVKMADGEVIRQDNVYANGIDPAFEWQNDFTNRLTVVGRGDTFSIYTNGTFIADYTASEYDRGFIFMVALSESGRTQCQFNNTWLWLME